MKIGLLSDTHGFLDDRVFEFFSNCDEIWHAGDFGTIDVSDTLSAFKLLRGVYGNIDGREIRIAHPLDNRFEVEGVKIWITHIGGYPGKYDARVRELLQKDPPGVFICGHSHILRVGRDKRFGNMITMNPGAAGNYGNHNVRTLLRFSVTDGMVKDVDAIDLGPRAFSL